MKKKLVKTPCGLPVGEAVSTKNGELGLEIKHGSKSEVISLDYLTTQVKKLITNSDSRKTEQGA